jgi:hypothetical protein
MGSSDWAAWVQAVGSVLAIVGAAFMPIWHEEIKERRQRQKWLSALAAMAYEVHDLAKGNYETVRHEGNRMYAATEGVSTEYEPLLLALADFPSHVLTDRLHLSALLHLRRFAAQGSAAWKFICMNGGADMFWTEQREDAKALMDETRAFADGVAKFR